MIKEYSPHEDEQKPDSSELQRVVNLRRKRLSETIDELGNELSPSRIIERSLDDTAEVALEKVAEKTNEILETATKEAKRNPWPFILVGAGLLLWLSRERAPPQDQSNIT